MVKWLFTVIFFISNTAYLQAQFYSTGESPASVKWDKLETKHFRIIFPEQLYHNANLLANKLENAYSLSLHYMPSGYLKKPYDVLLHASSLRSNGFVTLAPSRMELIAAPPQDSYAEDWYNQLSLHESKHMIQLNTLNLRFTGKMKILAGQIAPGIVSAQIPAWFYEGDAVYNETINSFTGRGRLPGFEMELRAILTGIPELYSFNKAIEGSYRDYIPDHYRIGYQMVKFGYNQYGKDFWPDALDQTARYPFLIWPFTFYLKNKTGSGKGHLYRQTMDSLKKEYHTKMIPAEKYRIILQNKSNVYTSYTRPKTDHSVIYTLRAGLADGGSLISTDSTGKTKVVLNIGRTEGFDYDVKDNTLVWTESVRDPRWQKRDYSILHAKDLLSGKRHKITAKSRVLSPDISPDMQRIAVVETDQNNDQFLTILDLKSGDALARLSVGTRQIQTPEWISNNSIAFVSVTDKGKRLETVDVVTGTITTLIQATYVDISEPLNYKNYILFRSTLHGTDNIYGIHKHNNKEIFQFTSAQFGAYYPCISEDSVNMIFSNYTVNGFEIVSKPITYSKTSSKDIFYKDQIEDSKQWISTDYTATPYRKGLNIIRFHSWLPFYINYAEFKNDPGEIAISPGFILFSQNLLGSVNFSMGYSYIQGYHHFVPTLSWREWYPVIEFSMDAGGPPVIISGNNIPSRSATYLEYNIRSYIPLVFNYRNYIAYFQPRIEYQHFSYWYNQDNSMRRGIGFLHLKALWSNYQRMAIRDLYPKWGQSLTIGFTTAPEETGQFGNMYSIQSSFYFPGIGRHHHINIRAEAQRQNIDIFFIPLNRVSFPRGFNNTVSREITSLKFNYSFPVAYPDLSGGPVFYLKRIRNSFFYDISMGSDIIERTMNGSSYYSGRYQSFGTEILLDINLFRFIFPLSAGFRIGYKPDYDTMFTEVLFNINTAIF